MTTQSTTLLKGILAAASLMLLTGLCLFYIDYTYRFLHFAGGMACQAFAMTNQYVSIVPLH